LGTSPPSFQCKLQTLNLTKPEEPVPPADQLTNVLSHPAPYPNTLASLTLIILFSEMLKFSKIISSKSKIYILKEKIGNFLGIFLP
jgi:hypothetical protein